MSRVYLRYALRCYERWWLESVHRLHVAECVFRRACASRRKFVGRTDQRRFRRHRGLAYRKTYYDQQWMYGFQYAPTANDVIDLTYVGNHSVHVLASGLNLNQLDPKYFSMGAALLNQVPNPFFGLITASGCGLDGATVAQGQLLRPHPEFCNINENQSPSGDGRVTTRWM